MDRPFVALVAPFALLGLVVAPAGAAPQAAGPCDPPAAEVVPPGPADPATVGPVVVGPVDAALAEHNVPVELRGSPASMARQHAVAVASELSFVGTLEEMERLAAAGELVPIYGGRHYEVMDWVFPYAIPEVRLFVERLAAQYREACGEALVVTSLTRPFSEQPRNAHQLSVHPAGMAVDLRIPRNPECRQFVEARLLEKEEAGMLDITRERAPPHYHIALFPEPYVVWASYQPPLDGAGEADEAPAGEDEWEALADDPSQVILYVVLGLAVLTAGAAAAAWVVRSRRRRIP
jgi:hypothetical protein